MPRVVDYATVLATLSAEGLKCNYPSGGSFGFGDDAAVRILGWAGPPDLTIKPALRPKVQAVARPYEENLTALAVQAWTQHLPGVAWIMPGSHWSYELNHGSRDWMPALTREMGFDSKQLARRTDASAIEFAGGEVNQFRNFVRALLGKLGGSDFSIIFPGRRTVCMIHHHKQLWWSTTDTSVMDALAREIL